LGRTAEAKTQLTQAVELLPSWSLGIYWSLGALIGETALLTDNIDEARAQATHALAFATTSKQRGNQAWLQWLLGEIAAQRESPHIAEAYYQDALALVEELGMRPLQAHCHRGLGTLYATTDQPEQARIALSTAIALYRDMEMTFWLPQTEATLAQMEGR